MLIAKLMGRGIFQGKGKKYIPPQSQRLSCISKWEFVCFIFFSVTGRRLKSSQHLIATEGAVRRNCLELRCYENKKTRCFLKQNSHKIRFFLKFINIKKICKRLKGGFKKQISHYSTLSQFSVIYFINLSTSSIKKTHSRSTYVYL